MTEKVPYNPGEQISGNPSATAAKKQYQTMWILFFVFLGFVIFVFLTQHKETINWIEDYELGIKQATQQNKPVLLAFYKAGTRFCEDISQNTYVNPDVIKYVEKNFVPIFIDVDKQPDIARRYSVNYYPTHYVKKPDSDELFGPILGYKIPSVFISELGKLLKKVNAAGK